MRKSEAPRRSSAFEGLFAERQVYLRSGLTSRYVVVSRPLQIAVTIGVGLVVAGLAFASYSSVVSHLAAAELLRELALAEARIGELGAARQADGPVIAADNTATIGAAANPGTAQLIQTPSSAEQRIEELTRELETSDAKVNRLEGDLTAALADAAALRRAAETAEAELADLQAEMARPRERPPAEREAGQDLAQIKEPATAEAEAVSALEASLAGGEAQSAARSAELDPARAPTAALAGKSAAEAAGGADELDRARAELRAANQRIAELEAAIRLGPAGAAVRSRARGVDRIIRPSSIVT
jgi:DNA repair exonuclease SbcCD ATPase subunit